MSKSGFSVASFLNDWRQSVSLSLILKAKIQPRTGTKGQIKAWTVLGTLQTNSLKRMQGRRTCLKSKYEAMRSSKYPAIESNSIINIFIKFECLSRVNCQLRSSPRSKSKRGPSSLYINSITSAPQASASAGLSTDPKWQPSPDLWQLHHQNHWKQAKLFREIGRRMMNNLKKHLMQMTKIAFFKWRDNSGSAQDIGLKLSLFMGKLQSVFHSRIRDGFFSWHGYATQIFQLREYRMQLGTIRTTQSLMSFNNERRNSKKQIGKGAIQNFMREMGHLIFSKKSRAFNAIKRIQPRYSEETLEVVYNLEDLVLSKNYELAGQFFDRILAIKKSIIIQQFQINQANDYYQRQQSRKKLNDRITKAVRILHNRIDCKARNHLDWALSSMWQDYTMSRDRQEQSLYFQRMEMFNRRFLRVIQILGNREFNSKQDSFFTLKQLYISRAKQSRVRRQVKEQEDNQRKRMQLEKERQQLRLRQDQEREAKRLELQLENKRKQEERKARTLQLQKERQLKQLQQERLQKEREQRREQQEKEKKRVQQQRQRRRLQLQRENKRVQQQNQARKQEAQKQRQRQKKRLQVQRQNKRLEAQRQSKRLEAQKQNKRLEAQRQNKRLEAQRQNKRLEAQRQRQRQNKRLEAQRQQRQRQNKRLEAQRQRQRQNKRLQAQRQRQQSKKQEMEKQRQQKRIQLQRQRQAKRKQQQKQIKRLQQERQLRRTEQQRFIKERERERIHEEKRLKNQQRKFQYIRKNENKDQRVSNSPIKLMHSQASEMHSHQQKPVQKQTSPIAHRDTYKHQAHKPRQNPQKQVKVQSFQYQQDDMIYQRRKTQNQMNFQKVRQNWMPRKQRKNLHPAPQQQQVVQKKIVNKRHRSLSVDNLNERQVLKRGYQMGLQMIPKQRKGSLGKIRMSLNMMFQQGFQRRGHSFSANFRMAHSPHFRNNFMQPNFSPMRNQNNFALFQGYNLDIQRRSLSPFHPKMEMGMNLNLKDKSPMRGFGPMPLHNIQPARAPVRNLSPINGPPMPMLMGPSSPSPMGRRVAMGHQTFRDASPMMMREVSPLRSPVRGPGIQGPLNYNKNLTLIQNSSLNYATVNFRTRGLEARQPSPIGRHVGRQPSPIGRHEGRKVGAVGRGNGMMREVGQGMGPVGFKRRLGGQGGGFVRPGMLVQSIIMQNR